MKQKPAIEKHDRSERKKKILLSVFIVVIMVMSAFAVFVFNTTDKTNSSDSSTKTYGGYTFYQSGLKWALYYKNQYLYFDYYPLDLEGVASDINLPTSANRVYIAQDYSTDISNQNFAVNHLASVLDLVNIRPVLSCIDETKCPDIPLVDCKSDKKVIYYRLLESQNEAKIYQDGSCVVLEGDATSLLKATNKIEYLFLGIMQ